MDYLRVKQAGELLGISPATVRLWCNNGKLPYHLSAAGQRIFYKDELLAFKSQQLGQESPSKTRRIFYARSSNGNDITIDTQIRKLTTEYGNPDEIITDKGSGLNENRKGLQKLLKIITDSKNDELIKVYVTNKDRLTRFGFTYITTLIESHNASIVVLDSDDTKEPQEILMQDFMSLLASFSGRFYRLRGWEQQKKLLNDVQEVVKHREKQ